MPEQAPSPKWVPDKPSVEQLSVLEKRLQPNCRDVLFVVPLCPQPDTLPASNVLPLVTACQGEAAAAHRFAAMIFGFPPVTVPFRSVRGRP
jgi:hypothetical protein